MKKMKRVLSLILCVAMIVGILPIATFAAESDDSLTTALTEAKTFIDDLTINNESNDPSTVVSQWGTQFSWDNEKRESNNKSYLFEWSYYNGVVFEGLDYIYDVTQDTAYSDYVTEYLSTMITSNGGWATCSNKSSKECAGYNSGHGADCYKTASLLLDYAKITGDSRYSVMAKTLYNDLQNAQNSYTSENRGYNYNHTWSSTPTYAVWLDGLYMIQPFMAEYAASINDTAELDRIAARFAWIGDNMYNQSTGLYYHAANSSSNYFNNNGNYWGRAIGWYAAAMVDVMDYMEGDNLATMQVQLKKLVDGMLPYQTDDGMWRQYVNNSSSTKETSATSLMAYTIMKGVNNGWLDSSYAVYATNAFEGICNYALDDSGLHYISFKGSTSGYSDPTYSSYVNEGKGVGPFIMAYAEVLEYSNNQTTEPEQPEDSEPTTDNEVVVGETTIVVEGVTDLIGGEATAEDKALIESKAYENFVVYDITATIVDGATATVSIPVPAEWDTDRLIGISVEDGVVKEIEGNYADGMYTFEVDHFSGKGVALAAETGSTQGSVSGTGNLVGGSTYTLDTNGVTANKKYLIVNNSSNGDNRYALTNNNSSVGRTPVTVSNGTITVEDDSNIAWIFSGSTSGSVENNGVYIYPERYQIALEDSEQNLTISNQRNGAYRIYRNSGSYYYYVRYNNNSWTGSRTNSTSNISSVYLFELTDSSAGKDVVFTVTPGSTMIAPEGTADLKGTVTVAGETVDLNDCTITWVSDKTNIATVSNGTVTGVEDGTANITATLSAVDGTALKENIVLTIPVTVQSKAVVDAVLTGNDPVTTRLNVEPDFSNIKLEVTYDNGQTGTITVDNGLVIEGYDISVIGSSYATISYAGKEYGTVRVTVEGNPYEGVEDATEYPEYPADGAVRIDKTATANAEEFKRTGVTHVELDVAGISVKRGVDVVLVADISNSMAWVSGQKNVSPSNGETTKWQDLQSAAGEFIDTLLKENEDGTASGNTVSFVTFGGYDKERNNGNYSGYFDATQTVFTSNSDAEEAKSLINAFSITGNDSDGYKATINGTSAGTPQGGTNYDYAFLEAAVAINQLKAEYASANDGASYDESGREIYVVFMTDGAPDHYNQLYYKSRSTSQFDYNALYRNSDDVLPGNYFTAQGSIPTYNSFTQHVTNGYYMPNSGNVTNANWINWIQKDSLYAAEQVAAMESVNSITAVGFDLENGAFSDFTFGEDVLEPVLANLAGENSCEVFMTDDSAKLDAFYASLATEIRFAGTQAEATDVIGSDFTLQMSSISGSGSNTADLGSNRTITITAYDLYLKGETNDNTLIGTRKGTSETLETVTFNEDGTEAYSNLVENETKNILTTTEDGKVTIEAHYYTYTKTLEGVETFKWTIGNITDKEIVLGFDVYMKGSLEGECEEGIYYTNEEATLEYIDVNGKHATQTFPVPAVSWGGASTTIRFYLVNEKGEPVNRAGEVVPMANCIYVGEPVTVTLNLNADATIDAQKIEAAAYVPSEYFLYDINASYTVQTSSGEGNSIVGGIVASTPSDDAYKTAGGKEQNGAQTTKEIDAEKPYYTWSVVGFGVRYDLTVENTLDPLVNDQVVIDYGKALQVNVLNNDPEVDGYSKELTGFVVFNANTDTTVKQLNAGAATYTSTNGSYSIVDGKVQFELNKMLSGVERVFYVVRYTNTTNAEDFYYLFGELDIIPATVMYYETDFADVFDLTTTGNEWASRTDSTTADGPQNDGSIGVGQTYGFDSTYENDNQYSDASSWFVEGQGIKLSDTATVYTEAKFSFTGTGFDLISRTGAEQGAIRVNIYNDKARTDLEKSITVLNKSESNLELYQIPVVSVNNLTYRTYYVTIGVNAAYTNETYPQLNRGGEFYFDAIRVYDPINVSNINTIDKEVAYNAYVADNEANIELIEVRSELISANDADATTETIEGVSFIDRTQAGVEISDYATIGPNNEVYLSNGQSIAFKITWNGSAPTSIDIGAKTITGSSAHMKAYISGAASKPETVAVDEDIISATSQFYTLVDMDNAADFSAINSAYVFVTNTGAGVLSITDLKIAYGNVATASEVSLLSSEDVMTFALACYSEDVEETPDVIEPEEEPNYDIISVEVVKNKGNKKNLVLEVVTTQEVEKLKITDLRGRNVKVSTSYDDKNNDTRVWKVTIKNADQKQYNLVGIGENGIKGQSASIWLKQNNNNKDNGNNKNNGKKGK